MFIAPAHESLLFHPILVWYAALHRGLKSLLYCQLLNLLCCKKVSVVENSPLTPVLFTYTQVLAGSVVVNNVDSTSNEKIG